MEDHSRTIIHIDIDCFYAQVEMVKQPNLRQVPLGIQQKNIVVTSNYVAREYGIQKCMRISEAKKLCPNLVLVRGEDLYDYRQVSQKVFELLHGYSVLVEKLGLDENFIDVSELVSKRLGNCDLKPIGFVYGDISSLECDCGCHQRLIIGSHIAQEIRNEILNKLGLTTCAGIACNKLLAKVVGSQNKPNKQTLLFPNSASELLIQLDNVRKIPWLGQSTAELLATHNINSVVDLQNCTFHQLQNWFGGEKAQHLVNISQGVDNSPVKPTGKPLSIGLEDSSRPMTTETEIEEKYNELLKRLLVLVKEDGRVPKLVRISLRRYNSNQPLGGVKESRQCSFDTSLNNESQILNIVMSLFRKAVGKGGFKINCLGLSFSKFVDKPSANNTLTGFLTRKCEEEPLPKRCKVQEETNTPSTFCPPGVDEEVFKELPVEVQEELWEDYRRRKDRGKTISNSATKTKNSTLLNFVVREKQK